MSIEWTDYKGMKILRVDYSGMDEAAMIRQFETFHVMVLKLDNLKILNDLAGSPVSNRFLLTAKVLAQANPFLENYMTAVLGLDRLHTGFLDTLSYFAKSTIKPFTSEMEALEWLISK